jgi:MFS family permease
VLGGIVFGHFGDKYGRKYLLQVSIIMVGVATFADLTIDTAGGTAEYALRQTGHDDE